MASDALGAADQTSDLRAAYVEGLRAAIHVGMVFKSRAMGVIRLYSRRPRGFDESERRLLRSLAEQAAAIGPELILEELDHARRRGASRHRLRRLEFVSWQPLVIPGLIQLPLTISARPTAAIRVRSTQYPSKTPPTSSTTTGSYTLCLQAARPTW